MIDKLTHTGGKMLELLMTLGNKKSVLGAQSIRSTNQLGQVLYQNAFGYCLSPNKQKFYVFVGRNIDGNLTKGLWSYDIPSNVWSWLGTYPGTQSDNIYWSLAAIDDNTLYMSCRLESMVYKVSTNKWEAGGTIPDTANIYGARSHTYNGQVYLFANNAATGIITANVFNPATKVTTTRRTGTANNGNYACSTLVGDKIYSFQAVNAPSGTLQIYDITLNSITVVNTGHIMASMAYSYHHGNYIYIFASLLSDYRVVRRFNLTTNLFETLPPTMRTEATAMGYTVDGVVNLWGGLNEASTPRNDFLTYDLGL